MISYCFLQGRWIYIYVCMYVCVCLPSMMTSLTWAHRLEKMSQARFPISPDFGISEEASRTLHQCMYMFLIFSSWCKTSREKSLHFVCKYLCITISNPPPPPPHTHTTPPFSSIHTNTKILAQIHTSSSNLRLLNKASRVSGTLDGV